MKILNLTQHKAAKEQVAAGVVDLDEDLRGRLVELLTFDDIPTCEDIESRAVDISILALKQIARIDKDAERIIKQTDDGSVMFHADKVRALGYKYMIGGAPFLMSALEKELSTIGTPVYAFSKREVIEKQLDDGSVEKKSVFKHLGFVEYCEKGGKR